MKITKSDIYNGTGKAKTLKTIEDIESRLYELNAKIDRLDVLNSGPKGNYIGAWNKRNERIFALTRRAEVLEVIIHNVKDGDTIQEILKDISNI